VTVAAELVGVTRRYGDTVALDDVSLSVGPGEIVALLGPNGAGKTTAIRILVGLRSPDRGRALLFGRDPRRREARVRLGCTPQETGLPPTLTVRETLELARTHFPSPARVMHLLERFDLLEDATRQVGGLSGGKRRRVSVALAFAGAPELLVLDEPTTGLDVASRRLVWDAVREHARRGGAALLTTHYLDEAEALATRIVVIARGRIRADGSVADVRDRAGLTRIRIASPDVPDLPGVARRESLDGATTLYVRDAADAIRELVRRDAVLDGLEVAGATLEEAFLDLTQGGGT
jgi:ABC-2 type transport system ATP-binding protein